MTRILVTGATGVLGRAVVPRLLAAGHDVRALSRSAANEAAIRALGAEPVRADLADPASLAAAVAGREAVVHLATKIPPTSAARRPAAWAENDRIREEGTRLLVEAALAAGVGTFVYPSVVFLYPDRGAAWIDAETVEPRPIALLASTLAAEAEVARFAAGPGRRGVVLRLGGLYGPDAPSSPEAFRLARRGLSPFVGPAGAYQPVVWVDDAAAAIVAGLDRAPSGVYDVVDGEPLTRAALTAALAAAVGRRRLLRPPLALVRRLGGEAAEIVARSQRVSNRRFKAATGWQPAVPSAREGLALLAAAEPPVERPPVGGWVRAGLLILTGFLLGAGAWRQFAPRAFYDRVPGFGWRWVNVDGPYNEHLLRDVGGGNLALGVVALIAFLRPAPLLVRAVALGALAAQAPHFVYHAAHVHLPPNPAQRAAQTLSLAAFVLLPALLLLGTGRARPDRPPADAPTRRHPAPRDRPSPEFAPGDARTAGR